ncbi:hypothetical protein JCM3775_000376 [Rhodotorula graminis]
MHRFLLVFLALTLALVAIAAEVQEQFVLGQWSNDPEAPLDKLTAHEVKYDTDDDGAHWACSDADEASEPTEQAPAAAQAAQNDADDFFDLLAGFAKGFMGKEGPDGMGGEWTRRIVTGSP